MKRFFKAALLICFAFSLTFGLFACAGDDKDEDNGQEQTTPADDSSNDDEAIIANGDNELPLIPLN